MSRPPGTRHRSLGHWPDCRLNDPLSGRENLRVTGAKRDGWGVLRCAADTKDASRSHSAPRSGTARPLLEGFAPTLEFRSRRRLILGLRGLSLS